MASFASEYLSRTRKSVEEPIAGQVENTYLSRWFPTLGDSRQATNGVIPRSIDLEHRCVTDPVMERRKSALLWALAILKNAYAR